MAIAGSIPLNLSREISMRLEITKTAFQVIAETDYLLEKELDANRLEDIRFNHIQLQPPPTCTREERIGKFFQKVMSAIYEKMNSDDFFRVHFAVLVSHLGDKDIRQQFVERIAFPKIRSLQENFDRIDASYVDEILKDDYKIDLLPMHMYYRA